MTNENAQTRVGMCAESLRAPQGQAARISRLGDVPRDGMTSISYMRRRAADIGDISMPVPQKPQGIAGKNPLDTQHPSRASSSAGTTIRRRRYRENGAASGSSGFKLRRSAAARTSHSAIMARLGWAFRRSSARGGQSLDPDTRDGDGELLIVRRRSRRALTAAARTKETLVQVSR